LAEFTDAARLPGSDGRRLTTKDEPAKDGPPLILDTA